MVEKLPITRSIWDLQKMPEKLRKPLFAQMLNGFFQDLECAVYTKIRLEGKK